MSTAFEAVLRGAIRRESAEKALARIAEAWPPDLPPVASLPGESERFVVALGHLLSVSPGCAEKFAIDPAMLAWLASGEVHDIARGPRRMRAHYASLRGEVAVFDERFVALRRCKARELARIALREVAGWASVEDTTAELTHLAELCVRVVCEEWSAELQRRWGHPGTEFAVLGMGKFGGEELNYSSDIDVIFVFDEEGEVKPGFTRGEYFARFAEKIISAFTARDPAGTLFRIDLRLRPEGDGGPLVRSLDSTENYYAAFGETWERMALIKARIVGGTRGAEELGYELFQRLQSFIYPRSVSIEMLDEVAAIKGRIEREIVGGSALKRNVKLGYGGIREVEFVAQSLQLLHGSKHAFLQERSTLKALRGLRQLGMIPSEDMESLIAAYRFLRTVEHRLQIEREAQTHTIPEDAGARALLAASLQRSANGEGEPGAWFESELLRHTEAVRRIFDKVLRSSVEDEPAVDLSVFGDRKHAAQMLDELASADRSPRTRKIFVRLEPELLGWLRRVADPDQALTHFTRFVERYGARSLLYETLAQNPRLLELLMRLFDASRFLSDIVIRRPQLIEEVARAGGLGERQTIETYLAGLRRNDEGLSWENWLRVFRRAQLVRIALRDLLGFAAIDQVQAEYSALAEACLVFAQRELGLIDRLTVIALGKFGGRELSYGADLDVMFIGDDVAGAAALMKALSQLTIEGRVFPIDARLRPEGEAGPLACSVTAFADYYERGRGQLWEAQALTKARPVSGPQQAEWSDAARKIWRQFGECDDLFSEIAAMHERVVRERAAGGDRLDFKTGTGGLMQLEFFTQAQQMRRAIWEPGTCAALARLADVGAIDRGVAASLSAAYLQLRRVEAALRRVDDTGESRLPADEAGQRRVAWRAGFVSLEACLAAYDGAREVIRQDAPLGG